MIRASDGEVTRREVLWFEAPASDEASLAADDAEPFVIATLMLAMKEGRALHAKGRVSKLLLQNLEEFMAFWGATAPATYRSIVVTADHVDTALPSTAASDPLATDDAMAAFSGGLDATFLAWRHHTKRAGWRSRRIRFFVMLSGFDIMLDHTAHVEQSIVNARAALDDIGATLKILRTNLRKVVDVQWNHLHGTSLVACMHFYKARARTLLVGSCESYDDLIIPWGSSPISDPLLSSAGLRVIHDSAEYSRSEKAAGVADWSAGLDRLRVCWGITHPGANCLKCEKCLRTMANFAAQGLPVPASLGGTGAALNRYIFKTKLRTLAQESEWRSIASIPMKGPQPLWRRWIPVLLWFAKVRRAYYLVTGRRVRAGANS